MVNSLFLPSTLKAKVTTIVSNRKLSTYKCPIKSVDTFSRQVLLMPITLRRATVHGVTKTQTRPSDWTTTNSTLWGSVGKNPPANAVDTALIPRSGRSPGVGNGNSIQCSCLGNYVDRGARRAAVHGVQRVGHDWATKQQHLIRCVALRRESSRTQDRFD